MIETGRGITPGVRFLVIACVVAFVLQHAVDRHTDGLFTLIFGLRRNALIEGEIWQLLTYIFLHGGVGHLILNMFGLFMFGREVEDELGLKRFAALFLSCGIVAGVGWVVISGSAPAVCIGASGAVFGIMGAFAAAFPDRRVALLLPPVVLTARAMVAIVGVITLLSLVADDGSIAHAAHLAGGVVGYMYGMRHVRGRSMARGRIGAHVYRKPAWFAAVLTRRGWNRQADDASLPPSREEVDRILEKIKAQGLNALSKRERDTLENASRGPGNSSS